MSEHTIPWEPIPREANWYMKANVVYFGENTLHDEPMSAIVSSTLPSDGSRTEGPSAWRITFHGVVAYRMRPIGVWWSSAQPITFPKPRAKGANNLEVAVWEIAQSRWLSECVPPDRSPRSIHHFVLADYDELYEVAAASWSSERLIDTWEDALRR
jgi:hypothetical protein